MGRFATTLTPWGMLRLRTPTQWYKNHVSKAEPAKATFSRAREREPVAVRRVPQRTSSIDHLGQRSCAHSPHLCQDERVIFRQPATAEHVFTPSVEILQRLDGPFLPRPIAHDVIVRL